ncbi:hypothetical protein H9P43_001560 [Blastocladiella emersonii ATCC 22665]|nr:hypothetical protein H9P43_001560 [Blastocladiella emersonii ATCC 22665]
MDHTDASTAATAAAANPAEPITLPATFKVTPKHTLTLRRDGSYTLATPVKCPPTATTPCPEAGGEGAWLMDIDTRAVKLFGMYGEDWTVAQTWTLPRGNLDARVLRGCTLKAHAGDRSDEFPLPKTATTWERVQAPKA